MAVPHLSTTALAAILTGVGVVLLGLYLALILLLIRAVRKHKRSLIDLEERGVAIAQTQAQGSKRGSITRPRAVLRRNTILPFNKKSGWGALQSMETLNPPDPPSIPPHYAPPKPAGFKNRPSRLSWPFSARRASARAIHLREIRVPVLSTVIESPKPSPLVPILSRTPLGVPSSPKKSRSRPTSDQSLLQHHPAFRNTKQEDASGHINASQPDAIRRSLTAKPASKPVARVRPNRSRSIAEIPMCDKYEAMSRFLPQTSHTRSTSMCSQSSGNAPDAPMPPLPLEIVRIKSQERRRSLLSRSPSRLSVSSYESAGSSILATQSSPVLSRSRNFNVQTVSKRDWRNSMIVGPRPLRDTLTLHGRNQRSEGSIKSSAARFSLGTPSTAQPSRVESRHSTLTNSSSMQSIKVKTAESVTLNKISSPASSPLTVRSYTPRRKSGSQVNAYGSPEERPKAGASNRDGSGNKGILERQLSQASTQASSTRSSNGNPFQWDPAPLSSGKPSALKGSPSARKGHRRQNVVRISLAPTILGPPSRSPSPSIMNDIQEESPNTSSTNRASAGIGFSSTRSLPRPPSSSTFAPDLKLTATSIRASLTPSSPTLSLAPYDYGPIKSPESTARDSKRISTGSIITIPTFPSPCHVITTNDSNAPAPPTFALSRPSNEFRDDLRMPDSPMQPSSPFQSMLSDCHSSPERPLLGDEHDRDGPGLVYQTPICSTIIRNFSSPFSTIPEESSATANRSLDYEHSQHEDSPPCSPKTLRPNSFLPEAQNIYPQYSILYSTIPEETPLETIDPAILNNNAFSTLNSDYNASVSTAMPTGATQSSIAMPTSAESAKEMLEPLLEAAFPSSPPLQKEDTRNYPDLKPSSHSADSPPSSIYSYPSPSSTPSPYNISPSSPRPRHAELPLPSLNFAEMPTLSPSPYGPRGSPPRPLRSSIAKLRRMNSDAEKDGKEKAGRGERRYLRLGREDSIALPGEESYLDELDAGPSSDEAQDEESTFDEAKGRLLIGNLLDWEEEATILDLEGTKDNQPSDNIDDNKPMPAKFQETVSADPPDEKDKQNTQRTPTSLQPATSSPKQDVDRSSSIWEDGERFWHSTPPHPRSNPPNSPNKPKNRFVPLSSSPLSASRSKTTNTDPRTPTTTIFRKRGFEVARDDTSPTQAENRFRFTDSDMDMGVDGALDTGAGAELSPTGVGGGRTGENGNKRLAGNRYRKRSVLGIGTPNVNVRIQVQPPSGGSWDGNGGNGHGTPGSLYDADGFLRA